LLIIILAALWLEIIKLIYKDKSTIILKLKPFFGKFGIPSETIVDELPFGSKEFLK